MEKTFREENRPKMKRHLSPTKVMIIGYAVIIIVGALLLCLPIATRDRVATPFVDALFTSTSASCVTGLVVFDTATYWSGFGQGVILFLIQIGGLGFITMAMSILLLSNRKIGLKQRILMQESISAPQTGGIVRLTIFVLRVTAIVEIAGAAILSIDFIPRFGWAKGIYCAFFHSISAFCNAGFDLMGGTYGRFSSVTAFTGNPLVVITLSVLIIFGGLGFFVWQDLNEHKFKWKRYKLQTKMVIAFSAFLIIVPAVFFFFAERTNPEFVSNGIGQRILASLFQAVTPRTAGFNTVSLTALSDKSQFLTIVLMLIGGSPGSTAGGMKTTTVVVLLLCVVSSLRKREHVELYDRRIDDAIVKRSVTILTLYLFLAISGTMAISALDELPLLTAMFEAASAIGTVGLSFGATPTLCAASHIILMFLMFFGRLGGLTMLYAVTNRAGAVPSRLPLENIAVG